jgi:hypothetical protein
MHGDAQDQWLPDGVKWLAARLSRLKNDRRTEHHAIGIHHTLVAKRFCTETAGHDLEKGGGRAKNKEGVTEELEALLSAAKTGCNQRFITAWARAGHRTHKLVWPRDLARQDIKAGQAHAFVSKPGAIINAPIATERGDPLLIINAPIAADAVVRIEGALAIRRAQPDRRRQPDAAIDDVIRAIAAAFEALAGRPAGLTYDAIKGKLSGPFFELCRDIGEYFGIPEIYSTSRLRRIVGRPRRR